MTAIHIASWTSVAVLSFGATTLSTPSLDERESLLEERRNLIFRDNHPIPLAERDAARIAGLAERALQLANKEIDLWKPVYSVLPDGRRSVTTSIWFEWLSQILLDAVVSPESPEERRRWAGEVEKLAIGFLKEPRLRNSIRQLQRRIKKCADSPCDHQCFLIYDFTPARIAMFRRMGTKRFQDELDRLPSQDLDYTRFAANAHGYVSTARMHLGRHGLLAPNEWGVQAALEWWTDASEVHRKGDMLHLSTHCLRKLGIPVRTDSASLVIGHLSESIRLPTSGPNRSSAFSGIIEGTYFVSIDVLASAGLIAMESAKEAQLVKLIPGKLREEPPLGQAPCGQIRQ